jgi:predicted nucleic acid-binding protein
VTLFDTSVIIDARDSESPWHNWAKECIASAITSDGAAVNTIVIGEASVRAVSPNDVPAYLQALGLLLLPLPISAAIPAAKAFARYLDRLKSEGKRSSHKTPLPDFFIGAHAEAEQLVLATRDPDRVRSYFPSVSLITP